MTVLIQHTASIEESYLRTAKTFPPLYLLLVRVIATLLANTKLNDTQGLRSTQRMNALLDWLGTTIFPRYSTSVSLIVLLVAKLIFPEVRVAVQAASNSLSDSIGVIQRAEKLASNCANAYVPFMDECLDEFRRVWNLHPYL